MYPFSQQTDEDILYQELRFNVIPPVSGVPNELIAGWSYEDTSGFVIGDLIFTDPDLFGFPINYANPVIPPRSDWEFEQFGGRDYDLGSHGVFGQYTIEPGRFILSGGGRYDRITLNNIRTLDAGQPTFNESFGAFSPKASMTYKLLGADGLGSSVNLYGAYSEAFRPPRVPSALSTGTDAEQVDPEEIRNYEGGVKASLLDDSLALEAGYFWMDRDGIVISIRDGAFFRSANAGTHEHRGVELGANFRAMENVSIFGTAAFYRNRFGDFVIEEDDDMGGSIVTDLTGNRLNMSPEYIVNWGALYSPDPRVDLTLDVKHVGDAFVDIGNEFRFDPYTIVDAAVSWRAGMARFTLSATNLFDEEYYWGGGASAVEVADPGRPRQVLLTTSFSFRSE
jgi:outer membrane receptor protein involved in Fe transport